MLKDNSCQYRILYLLKCPPEKKGASMHFQIKEEYQIAVEIHTSQVLSVDIMQGGGLISTRYA